ncbi:MAG: hypothetical protein ACJAVV_002168 [Alphaproteobacteria bacterium]|jgi:hypothetical protein
MLPESVVFPNIPKRLQMLRTRKYMKHLLLCSIGIVALLGCASSEPFASKNGVRACGIVTVFTMPPLVGKNNIDYKAASIFNINGTNTSANKTSFKLPPGKHVISILNSTSGLPDILSSDRPRDIEGKSVEMIVAPNSRYHIAAGFGSNTRISDRARADNWMPVIWKVDKQACQFKGE